MMPSPTMNPGVENFGLVKVRSLAAIEAEEHARLQAQREAEEGTKRAISSLSAHISRRLSSAKQAKIPIERQMLTSMRQRAGVYESDKLAAIKQMGGSEIYVMLTATKCRALEAWINDTLRPVGQRPWIITPTPVASLPPNIEAKIKAATDAVFEQVLAQLQVMNVPLDDENLAEEMRVYEAETRDKMMRDMQDEAKRRADRMALKIDDQLTEGGWHAAFWAVVHDMVTLKAGILKGPVIRRRKVYKWAEADEGQWEIQATDTLVPEYDRVSPFDFYPAADSTGQGDGDTFERHHLTRSDLVAMIGVPGYDEDAIRAALAEYGSGGKREILPTDSERAMLERGQTDCLLGSDKIESWEFWGAVPGRLLKEWGMEGDLDDDLEYEVNAWMVGNHAIRAIVNPDKLGRKPYSIDSFERVPGSVWGKGVPELMADIQDVCNAIARAIVNNVGLASGPQVEVNKDRCKDSEEIWPWKIWQATNQQMAESPAVRFFQPQLVVDQLLRVFTHFSMAADDQTGIPRWSHGNTNIGGAGETSSGLSMLMTAAARGVKEVISHLDKMISDTIKRTYDYNMLYDPDPTIKGDAQIVARASEGLMAKEQKLVRTNEFLQLTANPVDIQILGVKARMKLLRDAAALLDLDIEDELPSSDSEIAELIAAFKQMQMQGAAGQPAADGQTPGAPPAKPQTLDAAGAPAGGTDSNAFQNAEGVRT